MSDSTVERYGTDTSGRPILMTRFMHDWWEHRVANLGFRPVIVQGAFMARVGGGARASDGAHDGGGCFDVRTWDLTGEQIDALVWECRKHGGAAYRRDQSAKHGDMDPHCHITLGADVPDEDVWAALRTAQADGFVAALPQALDTRLGERGTSLSGG